MKWLKIIVALYLTAVYFMFVAAKARNPTNPAGFITPSCLDNLGLAPPK